MQFAAAWTAMAVAFGVHVIDEATTDFLASYNPVARQIRARLRLPFPPVFTFWPWFLGLLTVTAILFGLIPQATAQKAWMAWLALVFAIINIGNGLLHIGASMRLRRRLPGVISAPLLLACATWLLVAAIRLLSA